jgi:hypothetical protein
VANSKTQGVKRKHLIRQRAAKAKMQQHLAGKGDAEALPELARRYLSRRLRLKKRG